MTLAKGAPGRESAMTWVELGKKDSKKSISQKKWAGRSAPLDAIWENRNCIKSRD